MVPHNIFKEWNKLKPENRNKGFHIKFTVSAVQIHVDSRMAKWLKCHVRPKHVCILITTLL